MSVALAIVVGAVAGGGLWLVLSGLLRPLPSPEGTSRQSVLAHWPDWPKRLALAVVLGLGASLLTGWPVAGCAAGVGGFFVLDLVRRGGSRDAPLAALEALASWTEMVRDTMEAARSIEAAVKTACQLAPAPIAQPMGALLARLEFEPLAVALGPLVADLASPLGDLVVTTVAMAARGSVQDVPFVLSTLAANARETVAMRRRVDIGRARTRQSVKIVIGVTVGGFVLLTVFSRAYLAPYNSVTGQLVLAVILGGFGVGLAYLGRLNAHREATRYLVRPEG